MKRFLSSGNLYKVFGYRTADYRGSQYAYVTQRRMSTVHKTDFKGSNTVESNPFYEQYSEKLFKLKMSNPSEYKSRLNDLEESKKPQKSKDPVASANGCIDAKTDSVQSSPMAERMKKTTKVLPTMEKAPFSTKAKTLDNIMKLSLLQDKTAKEITKIWNQYHSTKDCLFATMPSEKYNSIYTKSKECPSFVYPLPRGEGYEFFIGQFAGHECHFASLLAYQTHKENAPSCLTVTHYTDLQQEKGIVLMSGEYDQNPISVSDAQLLLHQLQCYYGPQSDRVGGKDSHARESGAWYNLVKTFNHQPDNFKYVDVVEQLKNMTL